jgi:predicted metal-dependent hydrolase
MRSRARALAGGHTRRTGAIAGIAAWLQRLRTPDRGVTPRQAGDIRADREVRNPTGARHTLTALTEYTIRRSDRARRLRIVVAPEGVEVVLPRRMALRHAEEFVAEKRPWIERTLRAYRDAEKSLPPVRLEDGGQVPYLGLTLPMRVHVEPWRTRPGVSRRGGTLHVGVAEPGEEAVRDALVRWYRRQARVEIGERLDWATLRAGSHYAKLQIRDGSSRWASCSSTGTMSFSWRLLLAPEPVLGYVVEHEVAHLDVLDHSKRFWSLLESRCPDYRDHERWLRAYGPALRTLL